MIALTRALHARMAQDAELVELLSSYEGQPAIFTVDPPPGNAELPYIVTAGAIAFPSEVPEASKTRVGARVLRDVRCYAPATGSFALVERIGWRVFELFHRQELTIDGWDLVRINATGPVSAPAEEGAHGVVVTLSFWLARR